MNWKVAISVSGAVGFLLACILALLTSGGSYYFSKVDWERVNSMPYSEAQQYLLSRSEEISRFESLGNAVYYPQFWYAIVLDGFLYTMLGICCCWLYQKYTG